MARIRITGLPKKAHGGPTGGAADGLRKFMDGNKTFDKGLNQFAEPDFEVNTSISAVPRDEATIEAEGGETVLVPGEGGLPEFYKINGPRHGGGGVPLNVPEESFVFSDFKKGKGSMQIKDSEILAQFGISVNKKGKQKGWTPAKISKKYNLNKYLKVLRDPNSDKLEIETAEKMLENVNIKLAKLGLIQESMKGFESGTPKIAEPYMASAGITEEDLMPSEEEMMQAQGGMQAPAAPQGMGQEQMMPPEQMQGQPMMDPSQQMMASPEEMMMAYGGDISEYQAGGSYGNNAMKGRFHGLDIAQKGTEVKATSTLTQGANETDAAFARRKAIQKASEDLLNKEKPKAQNGGVTFGSSDFTGKFWDSILASGGPIGPGGVAINNYENQFNNPEFFTGNSGEQYVGEKSPFNYIDDENVGSFEYLKREKRNNAESSKWANFVNKANPFKDNARRTSMTFQEGGDLPKAQTGNIGYKGNDLVQEIDNGENSTLVTSRGDGSLLVVTTDKATGEEIGRDIVKKDSPSYDFFSKAPETEDVKEDLKEDVKDYASSNYTFDLDNPLSHIPEGERESIQKVYDDLSESLDDPDVRKALKEKHLENIKNSNLTAAQKKELSGRSIEDIVDNYKRVQAQIFEIRHLAKSNPEIQKMLNDKDFDSGDVSGKYGAIAKKLGLDVINPLNVAGMQSSHNALFSIMEDDKYSDKFPNVVQQNLGNPDSKTGRAESSKVDGIMGDTSLGESWNSREIPEGEAEVTEEGTKADDLESADPVYDRSDEEANYYLQDIANMGNLFGQRMGLKKYLPNFNEVDLHGADPTFYDPSRALAANAESAGMLTNNLAAFAGPQALSARASKIQGTTFKQNADTIGNYDDRNVGVANQFANSNAAIENQEAQINNAGLKKFYDESTIANQQFDNSKRQINRSMTDGYRQALDNKWTAQVINSENPYFKTDPSVGGGVFWTGEGRKLTGKGTGYQDPRESQYARLKGLKYSDKAIEMIMGKPNNTNVNKFLEQPNDPARDQLRMFTKGVRGARGSRGNVA